MNLQTSTRASIALASLVITLALFQSVSSLGRVQHPEQAALMAMQSTTTVAAVH